jgi:hypothetical protein
MIDEIKTILFWIIWVPLMFLALAFFKAISPIEDYYFEQREKAWQKKRQ